MWAKVLNAAINKSYVKFDDHQVGSWQTDEILIAWELKYIVKGLVVDELTTLMGESLNDIKGASFHNNRSVIPSAVLNVFEHAMMDLQRKRVILKTFGAHVVRRFDSNTV